MSMPIAGTRTMGVRVANLELHLDSRGSGLDMAAPECHTAFLTEGAPHDGLLMRVRKEAPSISDAWRPLYSSTETWRLWQDEVGRYIFCAPRQSPPRRHVIVDLGFGNGDVIGEFGESVGAGGAVYPLQDIDMVLFVNWLANFGDVILHASGVVIDGQGYCFTGTSGVGKSTLAGALAVNPSVTVLGEDQVVLRYLDGDFWIYGTPWHINPAMCSPLGAPLKKLFFLDRSASHGVTPIAPLVGITRLLQTAFVPYYRPAAVSAILDRLTLLAEQMPFYILNYRLGTDPLRLISAA